MDRFFRPEGALLHTPENREYLATPQGLERAMREGAIIEGNVTLCDSRLCLHVDLGCAEGPLEAEDAVYCRTGERRKDIAIISRVGKPIATRILAIERKGGKTVARLSRRLAQESCLGHLMATLRAGDIIPARVTHLEPFGAFLDVGCGVSSLLSVDCISVSRISHPRDRLRVGMELFVAVKSIDRENGRIYATLRELLGTWEENAATFEAGQTVTGIIRSVESYGVFVELAPNLAGLAEVRDENVDDLRQRIGQRAAVYIKSIVPERMKIKLVVIDTFPADAMPTALPYAVDPTKTPHLSYWRYSPNDAKKLVDTQFDPV
jgi:small subunit ribosomal protein S1